jgi:hypothetical protein
MIAILSSHERVISLTRHPGKYQGSRDSRNIIVRRNQSIIVGGKTGSSAGELFAGGICTFKEFAWMSSELNGRNVSTAFGSAASSVSMSS